GFDEEDVSAGGGVGESDGHAGVMRALDALEFIARGAEVFFDEGDIDVDGIVPAAGDAGGHGPGDRGDLALEGAYARLAGVPGNDVIEHGVVEGDLLRSQARFSKLPRDQVLAGDEDLFPGGVAGEADQFHAV